MSDKKNDHDVLSGLPDPIVAHIKLLERMRQDFVANVSHELRTPLTVIHGYLEGLLEQSKRKDLSEFHAIFVQMYQQSERMQNIVEDLLLLSRLESEEMPEEDKQPVDVASMLESICNDAREVGRHKEQTIHFQADSSLKINGVVGELRSLFSNLIFNAVKYTPAKGHIYVSWEMRDGRIHFQVRDTGIGIAEKYIPRLTERFYRIDKARSRDSGGTGLGLAIVKHILIRHGGHLDIQSELGKGSLFDCCF